MKYKGYNNEQLKNAEEYIYYLESYINILYGIFDVPSGIQELITDYKKKTD